MDGRGIAYLPTLKPKKYGQMEGKSFKNMDIP